MLFGNVIRGAQYELSPDRRHTWEKGRTTWGRQGPRTALIDPTRTVRSPEPELEPAQGMVEGRRSTAVTRRPGDNMITSREGVWAQFPHSKHQEGVALCIEDVSEV